MKAYRIYSGRKQDALGLIEHKVSNPTAREVRVRVRVCGVCRTDLHVTEGDLPVHRARVTPGATCLTG